MKLNEIDRAVFINLDDRPERRERMESVIAVLGLPFEVRRFSAADGKRIPPPLMFCPNDSAWGCYLSHVLVLYEAIRDGVENLLVFEDDLDFAAGFADKFADALAELPDDFDLFYLGGEHLKIETQPPVAVSDNVDLAHFVNLTTGYLLRRKAMAAVWRHLWDFERHLARPSDWWVCQQHVDRTLGEIAAENRLKVYSARPWLAGQIAGYSDIQRDNWPDRWFRTKSFNRPIKTPDPDVIVRYSRVGYGNIGVNRLGYDDNRPTEPPFADNAVTLSAHAPSWTVVATNRPLYLYGYLDTADAKNPVSAVADGKTLGVIRRGGDWTEPIRLDPGHHVLRFEISGANNNAHSVWAFREEPIKPFTNGETIEIVCNSVCPRRCPECNQAAFMIENPDYEFTPRDARALRDVLEANKMTVCLIFSGGEPAFWSHLDEVAAIFRGSKSVSSMRVTTSQDSRENIERLTRAFDGIYFSRRRDHKWRIDQPPSYFRGVDVWPADIHAVWPTSRWTGPVECCCSRLGVRASVIGQKVQPCVLGESLRLRGVWPDLELISIGDYFSGRKTFGQIGHYDACRRCVNNANYRNVAEGRET